MKYLLDEGLKFYKIPLPPVIRRKIVRRNTEEEEQKCLTERHFITKIPVGEERKRKKTMRCCSFVVKWKDWEG